MFAETILRTTFAAVAFLAMQSPTCAELGGLVFGPEFTKAYEAPTAAERQALAEQEAENRKHREAHENMKEALDPKNLAKGSSMDMSKIEKAITLRPNDAVVYEAKYTMLIAAGKLTEAKAAMGQALTVYDRELATAEAEAKKANKPFTPWRTDAPSTGMAAFYLDRAMRSLPPGSPQLAPMKTELCALAAYSRANIGPTESYSMHLSYRDVCP